MKAEQRATVRPPIRANEITANRDKYSKQLWKDDEEYFMGDDYDGEVCEHFWIDAEKPNYYQCTKCGMITNDYEQYLAVKRVGKNNKNDK